MKKNLSGQFTLPIMLLVAIVSTLFLSACGHKEEEKEEEMVYLATSPLRQDTTVVRDYVAQIHAIQHIQIRALEKGYLQKIYIDEGKSVRKGQLMFQIMPMIYEAEANKSQAEVQFAKIEFQNTKRLADSGIVAPNELALSKAKLQTAEAQLQLAQTHLSFTKIVAPFDGIMDHFYVRLGSLINEGDLLTNLSDNSKMWVYFNVPEAEYLDFKARTRQGDSLIKVSLMMANNKIYNHTGVVETIEADFNNETGNIAFRATFPNPGALLRHGETGNIRMVVPLKNELIIPQKATFEILEKKYVYVIDKNSVARSREIVIAAELPDLYILKSGLQDNEKILLEGLQKVRDGDKVTYRFEAPKQVMRHLKVYTE